MKFLIDTNPPKVSGLVNSQPDFVAGQLIVAASMRKNWGGCFGLDNSAFVSFDCEKFMRLQQKQLDHLSQCKFVACPDIVGNAKRTMEVWKHRDRFSCGFDLSLVLQNGVEDMEIPWDETSAVFVGGVDPWKESNACADIVTTAKMLGKHVHVGRVNCARRFKRFMQMGADTCDGSGIARFPHMLSDLIAKIKTEQPSFFESDEYAETKNN